MKKTRVVNLRKEPYDVYVGRPSPFGNPYSHKEGTLAKYRVASVEEAVEKYRKYAENNHVILSKLHLLQGKRLGCYCAPNRCHGEVLVELVEKYCNPTSSSESETEGTEKER